MLKKVLTAAVTLGLATGAQAYEPSFPIYIQGSFGQAKAEKPSAKKNVDDPMGVPGRLSSDRKDSAHKLIIGVQVNEYIALEAQYLDLGKSEYKSVASWDGGAGFEKEKLQLKTTGFGFNVVGSYPVTESFNVFAKTGLHQLKSKVSWREVGGHTGLGETWSDKASSSNSKWIHSIGVGASYELIPDLALVGEYERYRNTAKDIKVGSEKLGLKHNIDLLSVGLRYSF